MNDIPNSNYDSEVIVFGMPGAFTVLGVKKNNAESFETCRHDSPEAIGWTVTYDGVVWCEVVYTSHVDLKNAINTMVRMFNAGIRHNQLEVKKVLGIV